MGWAGNLSSRFLVVTDFCLQPLDLTTWKLADIPHLPSSESSPSLTYSAPQWEQREPRVDLLLLHCLLWVPSTGTLSQLLPSCLCFVWKIIKASSPPHTFPITKPSRLSLISWPSSPHTYAHRRCWGTCCVVFLKMLSLIQNPEQQQFVQCLDVSPYLMPTPTQPHLARLCNAPHVAT